MKMPDPMIPLMTIIVASNRVRRRAKPGLGATSMVLSPRLERGRSILYGETASFLATLLLRESLEDRMPNPATARPHEPPEATEAEAPPRPSATTGRSRGPLRRRHLSLIAVAGVLLILAIVAHFF